MSFADNEPTAKSHRHIYEADEQALLVVGLPSSSFTAAGHIYEADEQALLVRATQCVDLASVIRVVSSAVEL